MQYQSNFVHGDANISSMYLPGMGRITERSFLNPRKIACEPPLDLKNISLNMKKSASPDVEKPISNTEQESKTLPKRNGVVQIQLPAMEIKYQVWPGGPTRTFLKPVDTVESNAAAIQIQRTVRGRCKRINYRIMVLEHKLAIIEASKAAEIKAIQVAAAEKKLAVRRKATKKQAQTIKTLLSGAEITNEGSKLIQYLRAENKKLRKKNDKIATSIMELRAHNAHLDEDTATTGDHQSVLGGHYATIKETHEVLQSVVPKYEEKIQEMNEALDIRRQYCLSEHKMKVMYVKLIGTLAEMVENYSQDKKLIEEVVAFCMDMESEENATMPENCNEVMDCNNDDYDEVTVNEGDGSDSNNYDEYAVAQMG